MKNNAAAIKGHPIPGPAPSPQHPFGMPGKALPTPMPKVPATPFQTQKISEQQGGGKINTSPPRKK
jgi:hypothetical protein